jgi:hypothetical protein
LIPTLIDNHSFEEVDFWKASGVFHIMDWIGHSGWQTAAVIFYSSEVQEKECQGTLCVMDYFSHLSWVCQGVNLLVGQELLESAGLPFIGTSAAAARRAFDKVTFSFFMLQACHIVCDLLFGAKGRITSCVLNPKPYHVAHIVGILLSVSCFACTV